MDHWKQLTKQHDYVFMSNNTFIGLQVTLQATIELVNFLLETQGYGYLMTARLNQDALEVLHIFFLSNKKLSRSKIHQFAL